MRRATVVERLLTEHPDLRPATVLLGVQLALRPDGLDPPTCGDLAATFGLRPDTIRKRAKQLEVVGLVEVVEPETRWGYEDRRYATLDSGEVIGFAPAATAGGGPAPHRVVWTGVDDKD